MQNTPPRIKDKDVKALLEKSIEEKIHPEVKEKEMIVKELNIRK